MEKELVSLIIPIYNGEKYVSSIFAATKAQTYKNIEILFIDDGSTDGTLSKLKVITSGESGFYIYSKENEGVSSARNFGVEKAKGNYIVFADVDDYIFPDYIEKLYYYVQKYNADWAQCSLLKIRENSKKSQYRKYRRKNDIEKVYVYNQFDAMKDFAYRRHICGYPVLKIIRKELFKQLKFRADLKYSEDYCFTYELIKKSNKVVFFKSIGYLYIQQNCSATHIKEDRTIDYYKAWKALLNIYMEAIALYPEAANGILEKCYMQSIKDYSRIEDKIKYSDYIREIAFFLKQNGRKIACDRNNKLLNRLLGWGGNFTPKLLCILCEIMLHRGFYLRRGN